MTDGTRWPANIAVQPWAHVTDVSATKKTPQTHGIAAYRSLHSNTTPPLHPRGWIALMGGGVEPPGEAGNGEDTQ